MRKEQGVGTAINHSVRRSLAILEALTGQLYLAITLARLVVLHIKSGEPG